MFPFYGITVEDILVLNLIKNDQQLQKLDFLSQTSLFSQPNLPTIQFNTNLTSVNQTLNVLPESTSLSLSQASASTLIVPTTPLEQLRKRKVSEIEVDFEDTKSVKLSAEQKERKSKREKSRRKSLSDQYLKLAELISYLKLLKKPIHKMQRLEMLMSVVSLLGTKEKVDNFSSELETHVLLKSCSGLSKRKLKSLNEKRRRVKLRFVVDTAGELVGCEKGIDQAEVVRALLSRLELCVVKKTRERERE